MRMPYAPEPDCATICAQERRQMDPVPRFLRGESALGAAQFCICGRSLKKLPGGWTAHCRFAVNSPEAPEGSIKMVPCINLSVPINPEKVSL